MTNKQSTEQSTRRAEVVAGIRALSQLIEDNPGLPIPNSISAQHSIADDLDQAGIDLIRAAAALLGTEARSDADGTYARLTIAEGYTPQDGSFAVQYTVYGSAGHEAGELS